MRKYADFSGRARRSEYWWFYLAMTLIQIPFAIVFVVGYVAWLISFTSATRSDGTVDFGAVTWTPLVIGWGVMLIPTLAFLVPNLAAQARRLHDMGQSALWLLLALVGLSIVPVIMCIMDTQAGPNQWGPDPKADERGTYGYPPAYPAGTQAYPPITPPGPPAAAPFA